NHANQEVQISVFTAQTTKVCISKKTAKSLKDVTLQKQCVPPIVTMAVGLAQHWWPLKSEQSPKVRLWIYRAHGPIHPCVNPLCHHPVSLTEKGQIVAQKKRYPRRN
ncbi:hypothetical protein EI555_011155, partial [Monodon monoceros]